MRPNDFKVTDGPQGHFRCNPGTYERTYDKTCKSASLRYNLCNSVRRDNWRGIAHQRAEKVPLTRREHVNHAFEGHLIIVSILEVSWVTRILIEM